MLYSTQLHDTIVFHDSKITKPRFVSWPGLATWFQEGLSVCPEVTLQKCKLSVGGAREQVILNEEAGYKKAVPRAEVMFKMHMAYIAMAE